MGICESTNNQQPQTTNTINQNNLVNQTNQTNPVNQTNQTNQVNLTSQTNTTNNSTTGNNLDLSKIPERFLGSNSNQNNNQSGGFLNSLTGSNQNNTQSNGLFGNILGNNTQNNANTTNQDTMTKVINLGIENKDVIINGAKQILGKK